MECTKCIKHNKDIKERCMAGGAKNNDKVLNIIDETLGLGTKPVPSSIG